MTNEIFECSQIMFLINSKLASSGHKYKDKNNKPIKCNYITAFVI